MAKFDEQLLGIFLAIDIHLLSEMARKTTRSPPGGALRTFLRELVPEAERSLYWTWHAKKGLAVWDGS